SATTPSFLLEDCPLSRDESRDGILMALAPRLPPLTPLLPFQVSSCASSRHTPLPSTCRSSPPSAAPTSSRCVRPPSRRSLRPLAAEPGPGSQLTMSVRDRER